MVLGHHTWIFFFSCIFQGKILLNSAKASQFLPPENLAHISQNPLWFSEKHSIESTTIHPENQSLALYSLFGEKLCLLIRNTLLLLINKHLYYFGFVSGICLSVLAPKVSKALNHSWFPLDKDSYVNISAWTMNSAPNVLQPGEKGTVFSLRLYVCSNRRNNLDRLQTWMSTWQDACSKLLEPAQYSLLSSCHA